MRDGAPPRASPMRDIVSGRREASVTATTIRRVNRILQANSDVSRIADARH
jgi:hypothetical protein